MRADGHCGCECLHRSACSRHRGCGHRRRTPNLRHSDSASTRQRAERQLVLPRRTRQCRDEQDRSLVPGGPTIMTSTLLESHVASRVQELKPCLRPPRRGLSESPLHGRHNLRPLSAPDSARLLKLCSCCLALSSLATRCRSSSNRRSTVQRKYGYSVLEVFSLRRSSPR